MDQIDLITKLPLYLMTQQINIIEQALQLIKKETNLSKRIEIIDNMNMLLKLTDFLFRAKLLALVIENRKNNLKQ